MQVSPTLRQVVSQESTCPENCFFCPGLGLARKTWPQPGREWLQSCSQWSGQQTTDGPYAGYLIPGKLLNGCSWRRLTAKLKSQSTIVVVLADLTFDPQILLQLATEFPLEIWLIPTRRLPAESIVAQVPEQLHKSIRLYPANYSPVSDLFLTSAELASLVTRLKNRFPLLHPIPPERLDLYNPTLTPEDLKLDIEVVRRIRKTELPEFSVIIPTFNNEEYVTKVVNQLMRQNPGAPSYEVIVIDDGSDDSTLDKLRSIEVTSDFLLIRYPRSSTRAMGDSNFRAGLARTIGVNSARGSIYAFLDSDILVPSTYIRDLHHYHQEADVVLIQRLYLKEKVSRELSEFSSVQLGRDTFNPEGGYWRDFFSDPLPWHKMKSFWKYTCTYGLSVRADIFRQVGGFRSVFNSYGFEDTDLGYRLAKSGARFFKAPLQAYHLWHPPFRSEFGNSEWARRKLLKKTGNIFYRHYLDPEIYDELRFLLREPRPIHKRLRSLWS